jgi:hypothetical protein
MSVNEEGWRKESDIVVIPDVGTIPWDGFENAMAMIEAGERAAEQVLPRIRMGWAPATWILFPVQPEAAQTLVCVGLSAAGKL